MLHHNHTCAKYDDGFLRVETWIQTNEAGIGSPLPVLKDHTGSEQQAVDIVATAM